MINNRLFHSFLALVLVLAGSVTVTAADFAIGMRAYEIGDFEAAIRELLPLAEQGEANAQYQMGLIYHNGDGVSQSYKDAVTWFRRSAEQGHIDAQVALGQMFFDGKGIAQDLTMAYVWLNLAVAQGDDEFGLGKKGRRMAEIKMTPEQLARAQELSQEYHQKYVLPFHPEPKPPARLANRKPIDFNGNYRIQLGALADKGKVPGEWQRLQKRYPNELGSLQLTVERADLGQNRIFYRLQAGPLNKAEATAVCQTLRQQHQQNCITVQP